MTSEHVQRSPESLKTQALLERISALTAEYENKVADLRVELTLVSEALRDAQESLKELKAADVSEEAQESK